MKTRRPQSLHLRRRSSGGKAAAVIVMSIVLSRDQVRRVDQLAVERYGMTGLVLMENAGRNAAEIIDRTYGPRARAVIFCGTGNNGGDGCVIARHLVNRGWTVRLVMTGPRDKQTHDTSVNFGIIETMGVDMTVTEDAASQQAAVSSLTEEDVVVDALLGTGFQGEVRSPTAELIRAVNDAPRRAVVAIDVPSGLDCDTGTASHSSLRADQTITFVALKRGFSTPEAQDHLGRVEVADIGAPQQLIAEIASSDA